MSLDIRDPATFATDVFNGPDAPSSDDLATCVHCGLCLNACPTFRVTGLETQSPRGRIYLMTQWQRGTLPFTEDLADHIDTCLGCRTCEAVCPSGVPYGRIIEHGRAEVERLRRGSLRRGAVSRRLARAVMRVLLPYPGRLRVMGWLARAAQITHLDALAPPARNLPPLHGAWRPPASGIAPAEGETRHRVAFLNGCVMPVMYRSAMAASVRLLQLAGCEVWFPSAQTCCGALLAHNGDLEGARHLRAVNLEAFGGQGFDALVVNSAGCGAHLKDFYRAEGSVALPGPVKDLFEWLDEIGLPAPRREVPLRVTYQDPCHLVHAQRIRKQPRHLLRAVPGLTFVEMPNADICCGSAGIYNTLEPEMSGLILERKMDDVLSVEPDLIVTANPGCQLQLEQGVRRRGRRIPVRHLAELLLEAYEAPAGG